MAERGVRRRHPLAEGLRATGQSSSDTEHESPSARLPLARGQGAVSLSSTLPPSQLNAALPQHSQPVGYGESARTSNIVLAVLTALAFVLRFYKLSHPDEVVYVSRASCTPPPALLSHSLA